MTMKENHNAAFYDSKHYGNEADPLDFGVKEIYQLDDPRKGADPLEFEINDRDVSCNSKIMVCISDDDESGRIDSPKNEVPCGLLHVRSQERDADSLYSDTKDSEELHSSAALELSTVDKFDRCKESESRDSGKLTIAKSELLETDKNPCIDKNVLECQPSELIAWDKKINYHSVKDICIDEGMPAKDTILTRSCKDDDNSGTKRDDNEFIISNGLPSTLENTKSVVENESGNIEVNDDKLLTQSMPSSPTDSSSDEDAHKNCDTEDSKQTDEATCSSAEKIDAKSSEGESFVDRKLPIQEIGTRRSLMSLFNSFDGEGDESVQPLDQIFAGTEVSEGPASVSVEAKPMEDSQSDHLLYSSKLERGINFDFNDTSPGATSITKGKTENVKEQSGESGDVDARTDGNSDDISDSRLLQSTSARYSGTDAVEEQAPESENGNPDNPSDTSQAHCINKKDMRDEIALIESLDREGIKSNDLSSSSEVQFAHNKSQSSINNDDPPVEQHAMRHDHKNSGDISVFSNQFQYGEEESSFSAAGLVTYSGPIAYSGSLSLRSDGSATSGRSFAFPVLQSEWNSSPVRMAKADRRHYQKQKGWRSGILCCRF